MSLDCGHCRDLRARLMQPSAGSTVAPLLPKGALLIDGVNRGHRYLQIDDDEVAACPCGCHDTWRWANHRSLP
jgi:hypothetical protein